MVGPGDGLYEQRMETDGGEEWNEQTRENEKPLEQDRATGDSNAIAA
jgi:hypothetical protein